MKHKLFGAAFIVVVTLLIAPALTVAQHGGHGSPGGHVGGGHAGPPGHAPAGGFARGGHFTHPGGGWAPHPVWRGAGEFRQ